ncbi:hypothetical protein H8E07_09050 [bacterium]|nr:hypothetical protein [bacterium]
MKQPEYIPDGPFFRTLIPPEPRHYKGQRWVKMLARSAHVVLSGIYLGAYVFHVDPETRWPWFLAALISGLLMVCLDLFESGGFLLQLRGLVVVGKLIVLAALPVFGDAAVWVLAFVAVCSVISSHASSNVRYFLIWGRGRINAAETKG